MNYTNDYSKILTYFFMYQCGKIKCHLKVKPCFWRMVKNRLHNTDKWGREIYYYRQDPI